jgi:pilus assembly protein CpaF
VDIDIVLGDPTVSRRHARLLFRDAKWIVHDLRSMNGTTVNDTNVGRCELRPGDVLRIGENTLAID